MGERETLVNGEFTWYLSRAAGLVAWVLLALATIWGLLLTSRLLVRRPSPARLLDLHRHLGSLALILTVVHVGAIWLDNFVEYTLFELAIPFASDLETVPVALGVAALWFLAIIQSTSWQRARIPMSIWRRLHWLSAPLFVVATLHGWLVGTDRDHPVAAIAALILIAEVALIFGLRVRYGPRPQRERAQRSPTPLPPAASPTPAPSGGPTPEAPC
jgi:predicted ferric reductase